jgi:G3E family GTPase
MEPKKSNKTLDEPRTEITVFTGFLGAGKTTIITSLLSQIDSSSIFILKNEFGDNKIDSELLQTSISGVKEIINGCLCCVLVGQLKEALIEIRRDFKPNR